MGAVPRAEIGRLAVFVPLSLLPRAAVTLALNVASEWAEEAEFSGDRQIPQIAAIY